MMDERIPTAAADPAYPVVGDAMTRFVWREPALRLAAVAQEFGISATAATLALLPLSLIAFLLFWAGVYWLGLAAAVGVALLGLVAALLRGAQPWVAGLARSLEIVVPPWWWWAWAHGLASVGHPLSPIFGIMVLWAIVSAFVADQAIHLRFAQRFGGVALNHWRRFDSRFALVAGGRDTSLVLLLAGLAVGRPDGGLVVAAWWMIATLIVHAVRYYQARERAARGSEIISWLGE